MCFYDLQKAFDSVQYSVLLKRLYEAGVDGKIWRLLRSWYQSPKSMVRLDGSLSSMFTLERWLRPLPSSLPTNHGPPPEVFTE